MPRAEKSIIESESNEKKRWSELKFKTLLCPLLLSYYALSSVFNNIIIIALNNRMLNDSKFDAKAAA